MNLTEITEQAGKHKRRRRVGRGHGSGHGKTSGRGHKGQNSRSGGGVRPLTEGGQMPLFRRIPKRGFNNALFRENWSIVNVGDLQERFDESAHVTGLALTEVGLVRNLKRPIKILGDGTLSKKLKVEAQKFSAQALEKITAAGGEANVVAS
jgi:large subunit ribosomal protein L15